MDNIKTAHIQGKIDWENYCDEFGKEIRVIEFAVENPLYVLHTIFDGWGPDETRNWCRNWFYIAITGDATYYDDEKQLYQFTQFYKQLKLVLEALYIHLQKVDPHHHHAKYQQHLTPQQAANPLQVIVSFYDAFPIYYIHRELYDWLFAGIHNGGIYPPKFTEACALLAHYRVSCLLEAGWYLRQSINEDGKNKSHIL